MALDTSYFPWSFETSGAGASTEAEAVSEVGVTATGSEEETSKLEAQLMASPQIGSMTSMAPTIHLVSLDLDEAGWLEGSWCFTFADCFLFFFAT